MTFKELYHKRKSLGLCSDCGKPFVNSYSSVRCSKCSLKHLVYNRASYSKHHLVENLRSMNNKRRLTKQGLCVSCWKNPIVRGRYCLVCHGKQMMTDYNYKLRCSSNESFI